MTRPAEAIRGQDFRNHPMVRKSPATLRRKGEWEGAIVQSTIGLSTHSGGLPAGAYWLVGRNHGGLHMTSLPSRCCGFELHIRSVPERDVDYIGHLAGRDSEPLPRYEAWRIVREWRVNSAEDQNTDQARS